MEKDTDLRVRINSSLKSSAESILSEEGLTHSDAVQMLYSQIVYEGQFPLIPGKPTRRSSRHLDVRFIIKWLVDKITEDSKYFKFTAWDRVRESKQTANIFDYLTLDAKNHGRKINGRFHEDTHPVKPPTTGILTNPKEAYYILAINEEQPKEDALFLYYDRSPVFNPATIRFLGCGTFNKNPYFEDLFRLLRQA